MKGRWLSVQDICKYLDVSKRAGYKWVDMGGMPPIARAGCGSSRERKLTTGYVLAAHAATPGVGRRMLVRKE